MSDTSKATPRPKWQAYLDMDGPRWTLILGDGTQGGFITIGDNDEKHARLAEKALNAYNPERDNLARELAEAWLNPAAVTKTPKGLDEVARQLLKLYEEEKP